MRFKKVKFSFNRYNHYKWTLQRMLCLIFNYQLIITASKSLDTLFNTIASLNLAIQLIIQCIILMLKTGKRIGTKKIKLRHFSLRLAELAQLQPAHFLPPRNSKTKIGHPFTGIKTTQFDEFQTKQTFKTFLIL